MVKAYPHAYVKSQVTDELGNIVGLKLAENQAMDLGWLSHSIMADIVAQKYLQQNYNSLEVYFPFLFDNPNVYADGQFFTPPYNLTFSN